MLPLGNKKLLLSLITTLSVLLLVIASSSLMPIYPDEVAYKIFLESYFVNNGIKQTVTPYCTQGFIYEPNFLLRPAAAFWTAPHFIGTGWASYRVLSLIAILSLIALLVVHFLKRDNYLSILMLISIGIGPGMFSMVILRPEVFIVSISIAIYFLLMKLSEKGTTLKHLLISMSILYMYSLIAYLHPKAIYLAPCLIIGFFITMKLEINTKVSRIKSGIAMMGMILCIIIASQATVMHKEQFLNCAEYPEIIENMKRQSINLLSAIQNPQEVIKAIVLATKPEQLQRAIDQTAFQPVPDINYLPTLPNLAILEYVSIYIKLTGLLIFLYCLVMTLKTMSHAIKEKQLDKLLKVFICFGLIAPYLLSLSHNWYDAGQFTVSVGVIASLYILDSKFTKLSVALTFLATSSAIFSLVIMSIAYTPSLINGYSGPGLSIFIDRPAINESIKIKLVKYQIPNDAPIISDDLTYEVTKNRSVALPITYLGIGMMRPEIVMDILKSLNVEYGVASTYAVNSVMANQAAFQLLETWQVGDHSISLFSLKF